MLEEFYHLLLGFLRRCFLLTCDGLLLRCGFLASLACEWLGDGLSRRLQETAGTFHSSPQNLSCTLDGGTQDVPHGCDGVGSQFCNALRCATDVDGHFIYSM